MSSTCEPEHVSAGRTADDFCIDEDTGVACVTTHRENTIDCISLDPPGTANGIRRPAKLLRVELPPVPDALRS
jgi:hypothetical protein